MIVLMFIPVMLVLSHYLYTKYFIPLQYWKNLNVPFSQPWPYFGNIAPFVLRQKSACEWLQNIYKSHDSRYVGIYQFNYPTLMIRDLNLIKQLAVKDFDAFTDRQGCISKNIDSLFDKILVTLKGKQWRQMRATLSPAFTANKIRSMFILMSECAEEFTDYFESEVEPGVRKTIELKDIISRFANDVIATCAFGVKCNSMKDKDNEFLEMGKDAADSKGKRHLKHWGYRMFPFLMSLFKVKLFDDKLSDFFRTLVTTSIKTREEKGIIRPDMIHLLIQARKGKLLHDDNKETDSSEVGYAAVDESVIGKDVKESKIDLSDDDITAQALLFFIAGFDTVSTALSHMCYELALNEDIQIKLREEIDTTFKDNNGKISYEAIRKMKYLDMILSESLRKWPAGPAVDRVCNRSYTIPAEKPGESALQLKKNDVVWLPVYPIHRDPQYFPNPEKFDPERFSDDNKKNIVPGSYMPFGVGPRACIASRFALLEVKVFVVHLLSKFKLEICEKSQVPLTLSKKVFPLHVENGFWVTLRLRD